jgi:hypothetical protein
MQDADRQARGEGRGSAVLTEDQARKIKTLITQGLANQPIASSLGIAPWLVDNIRTGKAWAWLEVSPPDGQFEED